MDTVKNVHTYPNLLDQRRTWSHLKGKKGEYGCSEVSRDGFRVMKYPMGTPVRRNLDLSRVVVYVNSDDVIVNHPTNG